MPTYSPECRERHSWQTDSRYYIAEVTQDLFGQWQLHRRWGSRSSARGGEQRLNAVSYEDAIRLLNITATRRKQRGYQLTTR